MSYPDSCIFDIQTLVDASAPDSILVIGHNTICNEYLQQRELINKPCNITNLQFENIQQLSNLKMRFDLAIVIDTLEHLNKQQGQQLLAQLRDIYSDKFCVALALHHDKASHWQQSDLFAFAMTRVNEYGDNENATIALYKYDLNNYKNTPDWLNPNNWANPEMWNKFRW